MSFVFLSYARENQSTAASLVTLLQDVGLDVFWDQELLFGSEFRKVIADRLESAACVLVLWSKHSCASRWVIYEAHAGLERDTLVEARLDDSRLPPPFGVLNVADLRTWRGGARNATVARLVESLQDRIRVTAEERQEFTLAAPTSTQPITDSHLALIHTCWRSPKYDLSFGGVETYRWDLALYGSAEALDRVTSVSYFLHPAYELPGSVPRSRAVNKLGARIHRETCFRLRQIANGHSLVRAHISIAGQAQLVKLSRYLNLFDSSADIADYRM